MDDVDYKILSILKDNAREKASSIGKKIHLSVSSVIDHIHNMEKAGIITGYTIIVDQSKLGNDTSAIIEVKLEHSRFGEAFEEYINGIPEVVSCYYMTGEYDYIIHIDCSSSKELEKIHKAIKEFQGVSLTRTQFILKVTKNRYQNILNKQ